MKPGNLRHTRILVTGAAGFLGSYLIPQLLKLGVEIIGLDIRNGFETGRLRGLERKVELVEADMTNYSEVADMNHKFDHVIHLAGMPVARECDEKPAQAFSVNTHGTYNLLKFALHCGAKKFIFASTAHVYGISPKYMPSDERHPLALQDTYSTTKILGESLCQLFYSNHNLAYTVLRLFNGYGPRQTEDYFIPAMISKAKIGHIELMGRNITKDFVYVTDIVDAVIRTLGTDYVGEINIGSGVQTKLEVVARHIATAFGAKLTFVKTQQGGPTQMQCDPTRASMILGWTAKTPLQAGLDHTIASFRKV